MMHVTMDVLIYDPNVGKGGEFPWSNKRRPIVGI